MVFYELAKNSFKARLNLALSQLGSKNPLRRLGF